MILPLVVLFLLITIAYIILHVYHNESLIISSILNLNAIIYLIKTESTGYSKGYNILLNLAIFPILCNDD